jgi:hypothetical protein
MFTSTFRSPRLVVAMMVEGDEKSKHIFSLGGWVWTTQQAKELMINVLQKPKLTIQKKVYVVELWIFKRRQTIWVAIDSLFRRSNINCLLSHILILTQSTYPWDRIPYLAGYISTKHALGWGYEFPCVNCDWNNDSVFRFLWCQLENTLVRKWFDVGTEMMQL